MKAERWAPWYLTSLGEKGGPQNPFFAGKGQDMRWMQYLTSLVARAPVESLPPERPSERPAEPLMDF
ncbi:hypothetical protein TNIN_21731 [Trichonephila inaurata madagascariensis]|uniref:Uncharacterized protein n=1 Tax=Trichonephila inaurata madagascariensis TaxID=2747483 RepID=A0A8X6YIJ4_9ARAC|nr:hypothetical protein TNIN_21731 [Trichonephila inaurata madagascariensis]